MKTFLFLSLAVLASTPAFAKVAPAVRQCEATLFPDEAGDFICRELHKGLQSLSIAEWNRVVCGNVAEFRAGEFSYTRDADEPTNIEASSGSMLCVWDVKPLPAK